MDALIARTMRRSHQKAHEDGRSAQRQGKEIYDNPYPRRTHERIWWYAGFRMMDGKRLEDYQRQ